VVDPGRLLRWSWREHRGTGFGSQIGEPSTVTIELEPVPDGTRVRIVEDTVVPETTSTEEAARRRRG
jgi:uncharacterized protein YndB with AHSA1/START domain